MNLNPHNIVKKLSPNATSNDVYEACEKALGKRPINADTLESMFQSWTDHIRAETEGHPAVDSLSVETLGKYLNRWLERETEDLHGQVMAILERERMPIGDFRKHVGQRAAKILLNSQKDSDMPTMSMNRAIIAVLRGHNIWESLCEETEECLKQLQHSKPSAPPDSD